MRKAFESYKSLFSILEFRIENREEMRRNMKIELHFHTKETSPCGKVPAKEGIWSYKAAGYDAVVVTDHFSAATLGTEGDWETVVQRFLNGYEEAKKFGESCYIKVYLGMEIRFDDCENDFLVYGISREFLMEHPWIYRSSLEKFSAIAREWGCCIIQAHPFRDGCRPVKPNLIDGVEIWNTNPRQDSRNYLAAEWSMEHQLLQTAGSDYHREGDFSGAGILVTQLPNEEKELAKLMKAGEYEIEISCL